MDDIFFQLVLFLGGAIIGVIAQIMKPSGQKKLARVLALILIVVSIGWLVYTPIENESDNPPPSPAAELSPPNEPSPPIAVSQLYDDFNNPQYDNSYNQILWRLAGTTQNPKAQQQNGIMTIINDDAEKDLASVLVAREYDGFTIDAPFFIEANLFHPGNEIGRTILGLYTTSNLEQGFWSLFCNIHFDGNNNGVYCIAREYPYQATSYYETPWQDVEPNTWHKFRIEIDPSIFSIKYYIDENLVGIHVPDNASFLQATEFQVAIVSLKDSLGGRLLGQFDDVKIGYIK